MKKIVGTIAAIALAASSAFAGANFGMGFNRGFFTPFAWDGEAKADISTSWGKSPRIGASFSAASEDVGVVADVKFDGGSVAVNDNAYIWVKPASWLKIQIGQSFDDTLRGNACFGTWDCSVQVTSLVKISHSFAYVRTHLMVLGLQLKVLS